MLFIVVATLLLTALQVAAQDCRNERTMRHLANSTNDISYLHTNRNSTTYIEDTNCQWLLIGVSSHMPCYLTPLSTLHFLRPFMFLGYRKHPSLRIV